MSDNVAMLCVLDAHGVVILSDDYAAAVAGGDIEIYRGDQRNFFCLNTFCGVYSIPAPVYARVNYQCNRSDVGGYLPEVKTAYANALCSPDDPGLNPLCAANAIC
jgi:hypothetical protein